MCAGGGQRAVINMPDTGGYDRLLNLQIAAMQQQQEGQAKIKQAELNRALQSQQQALTALRDFNVQRANDVAANAARRAALIGAPPPDKGATSPLTGSSRKETAKSRDRASLRINRLAADRQSAGSGLNINTGS